MADLQSPRNPHFFKPLLPGFHSHLTIPVKFFSLYIEGKNEGNTVKLRSDVSDKTWKVKMENQKLTIGWKEFAIAHDFQIGDIIVFRHEGDLMFHVTCFGLSFCEIQYVHSSNNDHNLEDDENNIRKCKHVKKRILETESESFSSDQSCFVAHVTESNLRKDTLFLPRKFEKSNSLIKESNNICIMNEGVRTWTLNLKLRPSSRTFYMKDGWRNFCHDNGLRLGDSITFKLESNNTKTPLLRFSSSKSDSVSTKHCSKQKSKSIESSQRMPSSSLSENQFVTLNVTPYSLKNCRLYLPRSFTKVNNMEKVRGKKVTLLDKHGVEWPVNIEKDLRLGLGLKDFFKAIGIKAYESFVLELESTTPFVLKFCSKVKT